MRNRCPITSRRRVGKAAPGGDSRGWGRRRAGLLVSSAALQGVGAAFFQVPAPPGVITSGPVSAFLSLSFLICKST